MRLAHRRIGRYLPQIFVRTGEQPECLLVAMPCACQSAQDGVRRLRRTGARQSQCLELQQTKIIHKHRQTRRGNVERQKTFSQIQGTTRCQPVRTHALVPNGIAA